MSLKSSPPQLHFQLTDSERAACEANLQQYLRVALTAGAPPIKLDSYYPVYGGLSAEIDGIVNALIKLTIASQSKDGSDALYKDYHDQIQTMVQARVAGLVRDAAAAALQAATAKAVANPDPALTEAEGWVRNYLKGNGLAPDPLDSGQLTTVLFDAKPTPFETAISTTVAAGGLSQLQSGQQGRAYITSDMVRRIATTMLTTNPADPKKTDSDDDDDGKPHQKLNPVEGKITTNVEISVDGQIFGPLKVELEYAADGFQVQVSKEFSKSIVDLIPPGKLRNNIKKLEFKLSPSVTFEIDKDKFERSVVAVKKSIEASVEVELNTRIAGIKLPSFELKGTYDPDKRTFGIGPEFTF